MQNHAYLSKFGFQNTPRWFKWSAVGWIRRLRHNWGVRCTDIVDVSPNNALSFIDAKWPTDCYLNKAMTGKTVPQLVSDMIRDNMANPSSGHVGFPGPRTKTTI